MTEEIRALQKRMGVDEPEYKIDVEVNSAVNIIDGPFKGFEGKVAEIQQSGPKAGMGFDRAAVTAAEKTTWQPAMVGEVPVKMWVDLRMEFKP